MENKNKPYWQQRRDQKLKQPPSKTEEREKKEAKGVFFADQVQKAPAKCENCGKSLAGTKAINPAAIVAHILAKSKTNGCPSVALHPLNKFYACGDCHTDYDTKGAAFVQSMPIFPTLKERVAQFYHEISPAEKRRVPEYFRP
jgi:hypothetical protein